MKKTADIVIVDDDALVTRSLGILLDLEGFTNVHPFNNPLLAIDYIKQNKPSLVISDFVMPEMNGIDFLIEVKNLYKDVSLILLTGYADKENAIRAINEVGLYKYIEKPWDNASLIRDIENALERTSLLAELENKIKELEVANKKLEDYSNHLEDLVEEKTKDIIDMNSKMTSILQNCVEGILTVTPEGKICEINSGAENIFGLTKQFIDETPINHILKAQTDILTELNPESSKIIKEVTVKNPLTNAIIPLELSVAPIIVDGEFAQKYVVVIRDVTVEKEIDRMRDDFIATLTHDLRTPLLASIQALEFLLNGTLGEISEKQTQILSTMKNSDQDMLGLVNALLEVYKYEAGKLNLAKTDFKLNDLAMACYNEVLPLAKVKKIELLTEIEETENKIILADRTELRRVIINLLGNALNHTFENGKVTISTTMQEDDFVLSVTDTGIGIPRSDIPKLFKRFSQGTSDKRSASTGLGLYLSRQIIEAHGGKIWLESDVNEGSCFSILIPQKQTDEVTTA